MKVVKQTDEYTIFQKRSGRYAVQDAKKNLINGDEKANILLAESLIKLSEAKQVPAEEEVAEEAPAAEEEAPASEETTAETGDQ